MGTVTGYMGANDVELGTIFAAPVIIPSVENGGG